jgi:GMP synthase (glutamine-hydrolysing)
LCVYHWHGDGFELLAGARLRAMSSTFPNAAVSMVEIAYGVQLHPGIDGAIMRRWIEAGIEDGDMKHNSAQSGAEQEAMGHIHEPGMQAWFDRFLAHWLDAAGAAPDSEAGE